ncbi:uncharacterized protein LOC109703946 isoform X2 [Ananas comosus]|uniref:Uncharacterized protein LOC109703946 isoform X2 n=1 Tax=Ananas comosus TaxID=4615 RepID=A0A6P5EB54_ANACO|nr:uncharacterized protein LOC109703946 isoform X2 [Ananas comosus]
MAVAANYLLTHLKCHHQASHSPLLGLIGNNGWVLSLSTGGSWMKPQRVASNAPPIASVKPPRASNEKTNIVSADNDDGNDGVSLGTMKLPSNIDVDRFEILLFQVDKVQGGVRLGFIKVDDGKTEVQVYIDCLVFPATESSGPIFQAVRKGPLKDQVPPGEPRIMRSLLQALQTSVEIAKV